MRTARDLNVTSPELLSRLYQHATYLSNRFERSTADAGAEEDAWLAHEAERARRAQSWTPERRAHLDAAVAIIAPMTAVTSEALAALAAEIPAGRIGTHLAAEQLEAQVEAMTRLPDRLIRLARVVGPTSEWKAAFTDLDPVVESNACVRVLRGGSWTNGASYVRSATRGFYQPYNRDSNIGFRVAKTLE